MSSSDEPRRCAHCGAVSSEPGARYCAQCGRELAPEPPPDPFGDVAERFRAARARAELPGLLARAPEVPELAGSTTKSVLALLSFAVVGLFLCIFLLQLCAPLALLPLALVVFGGYALWSRMARDSRNPLVAELVLVREHRTRLQVGARHAPDLARHIFVLERADGTRFERESLPSALARLEIGALGVVHSQGERLVAFELLEGPSSARK
jgi:signal transduction histidine kinase